MNRSANSRLDELLLARATEGLDAAEATELEQLLEAAPRTDAEAYDRAAAAICLAVLGRPSGLPPRLRQRIEERLAAERLAPR